MPEKLARSVVVTPCCRHHSLTERPLLRHSWICVAHSCSFARCFNSALVILTPHNTTVAKPFATFRYYCLMCVYARLGLTVTLHGIRGPFSHVREWPPLTPKRTQGALPLDPAIARFGLEELLSLRNRVSAAFCCDTIWLAPIIRCRSAHLVEVQPNFCLLWICTILLMPAKAALLRSPRSGLLLF